MSAILLDQEGVADVTAFTLGGAGTSFVLGEREIGVPGTVTLTKIQPVGAVLKASEAGEALLREAGERVNARLLVGQADAAGLSRWEREYGLADRSGEDGARRRAWWLSARPSRGRRART